MLKERKFTYRLECSGLSKTFSVTLPCFSLRDKQIKMAVENKVREIHKKCPRRRTCKNVKVSLVEIVEIYESSGGRFTDFSWSD
jgi:hypothetical protein